MSTYRALVIFFAAQACGLPGERVDHGVRSSPGTLHNTVRHVLRCNRSVFRDVPGCADRPRLNAASANGERQNTEKNVFMVLKVSLLTRRMRLATHVQLPSKTKLFVVFDAPREQR